MRISNSFQTASFSLHEDDWIVKSTGGKVSREMLMIALQGVQQILIRTSETMDATR